VSSHLRAVILNGAAEGNGSTASAHSVLSNELIAAGWKVETFILRDLKIHHCLGCFDCWVRTPGLCTIDDDARPISQAMIQSDLVVLLSPVSFGCYSAELKRALDRIICLIMPFFTRINGETHHRPRYGQYPRWLGLGVSARADEESARIFKTLVGRNAVNFHAPAWAAAAIQDGRPENEIRSEVRGLLSAVEVGR